jgi:hypothetical protein
MMEMFPDSQALKQHFANFEHIEKIKLGTIAEGDFDDGEEWFDEQNFNPSLCRLESCVVVANWAKIEPLVEDMCQRPGCKVVDFCSCSFAIYVSPMILHDLSAEKAYFAIRRECAKAGRMM